MNPLLRRGVVGEMMYAMLTSAQVWDTAGQERFSPMAPLYYRNANAALVVYDVTNFDSFTAAQRWIDGKPLVSFSSTVRVLLS